MRLRSPMPELDGATKWLNGKVSREDLIGKKPTLIHFSSTSCEVGKDTMDVIHRLKKQCKNDLNIVAVHMPLAEEDYNLDAIEEVAFDFHIDQPIYVDSDKVLSGKFQNEYVPAYYLFDRSGLLRHYQIGDSGMTMLNHRLQRLLGKH